MWGLRGGEGGEKEKEGEAVDSKKTDKQTLVRIHLLRKKWEYAASKREERSCSVERGITTELIVAAILYLSLNIRYSTMHLIYNILFT